MEERDVVIVGGGPAGYRAAIRVAQLGGKATLIERDVLGGTCINRGCIPTRTLLRGAEIVSLARMGKDYGVTHKEIAIDMPRMVSRKNIIVRTLLTGIKQLLNSSGTEMIEGKAKLISPSRIEIEQQDGRKREIKARRILLTTGSRWKRLSIPGGEKMITSDELLDSQAVPESLMVIGGGFVGVSMATIFSRLGSDVTIVEESHRILPEMDKEIVSLFEKELENERIHVYTGARLRKIEEERDGKKNAAVILRGEETNLIAQFVLIGDGREPNVDDIGAEKAGIKLDPKGGIAVNRRMETNVPTILAAGDITMRHMWTHVAYAEGIVAAENAMGKGSEVDYRVIPYVANTVPEISGVGMTEDQAVEQGYDVRVARVPFSGNGQATILGQRTGMLKMVTEAKYGQILGVHIIGPHASDLIGEVTLAMKLEITPAEIDATLHVHPALSESIWEAAKTITGT